MRDARGVSSVLGVVLILAITVAMVTSLMVAGTLALNTSQRNSGVSQMENSMSQMSSQASLVALGEASSQRFDFGDVGQSEVNVDSTAGALQIYLDDPESGTTIYHTDELGAMVFEDGENTVGYQAGGVWTKAGASGGKMISPPEFHYRTETLTLPIIQIVGDATASGSVSGSISKESETMITYPTGNLTNPVDDATVFVEIQSEYHRGWFNYLESRSDGTVEHDPENETVLMELSIPFDESFDSPIAVQDSYELQGNPDVDEDEIEENSNYPSVSGEIEDKIAYCEENGCEAFVPDGTGETTFDGGATYFTNDSIDEFEGDIIFNTTADSDVDVVVNGTFEFSQNDIIVEGGGQVRMFFREAPAFGNQEINMEGTTGSKQFLVYMHSDIEEWDYSENPTIRGIIYAPMTDVTFGGSIELIGALVANTAELKGSVTLEYDENLENVMLGFNPPGNVIRYLHVTVNKIALDFD